MEEWAVFYAIFLGDDGRHPETFKMFSLVEEMADASPRLCAQARQTPSFPAALLNLIQTEFNEIFCQALERRQRVN